MIHHRTCNLCEAMCGLVVEHDGATVRTIRGDRDDPLSRGHICPKALGLKDIHEDPDRLRHPMRRIGDSWHELGWDEAFDLCADRLVDVQRRHGRHAVAVYGGNPNVHNHGTLLFGMRLRRELGTRSQFGATSLDQLPHMLAALEMFGHQLLMPVPDVDRADYLLMLGANPVVSGGSIMVAPGFADRVAELRRRGGRLVVVDPRRTETAAIADEHVAIRPGTDALWLAALVQVVFAEGLVRPGALAPHVDGVDRLAELVAPFTPEAVAAHTAVDAATTRRLARELATARRGACYGRVGICTQRFGGLAAWLVLALDVCVGKLDVPGGMMFAQPAADFVALSSRLGQRGHFDKGRTRVRGLPEFGGEYPAIALAEEIETEGEGRLRALVTLAGNPVLSTPNGRRIERALPMLDFMVSIDPYLNETTRHAHVVLPPVAALEQSHYDLALHGLAVRNTAKYSPALFAAGPGARADWQIHLELTTRIALRRGGRRALLARAERAALSRLGPDGLVDLMIRFGPRGRGVVPGGLSLGALKAKPHGVDLGPLEPCLLGRLGTRDHRIHLVPPRFAADVERLRRELDAPVPALVLIGRRQLRSNNSWMHNSERLVKGPERCTLLVHPDDAAARGLDEGARVVLRSRVGAVEVPVALDAGMMRGVVSLPHGFGHGRPGTRLSVAAAHAGASINDVLDDGVFDELTGTAALNGIAVELSPAGGAD